MERRQLPKAIRFYLKEKGIGSQRKEALQHPDISGLLFGS